MRRDSGRWRAPPGCVWRRRCRLCPGCGPRCRAPEGIAMPGTGRWPLRPPPGAALGAAGPKDAAAPLGGWPRKRCPGHGSPLKFALDDIQTTPWRLVLTSCMNEIGIESPFSLDLVLFFSFASGSLPDRETSRAWVGAGRRRLRRPPGATDVCVGAGAEHRILARRVGGRGAPCTTRRPEGRQSRGAFVPHRPPFFRCGLFL